MLAEASTSMRRERRNAGHRCGCHINCGCNRIVDAFRLTNASQSARVIIGEDRLGPGPSRVPHDQNHHWYLQPGTLNFNSTYTNSLQLNAIELQLNSRGRGQIVLCVWGVVLGGGATAPPKTSQFAWGSPAPPPLYQR
jgi:hypothetical protein